LHTLIPKTVIPKTVMPRIATPRISILHIPAPRIPATRLVAALLVALLAAGSLTACDSLPSFMSFPPQVRGNKVDNEVLGQLVPGTSTRADVTALIGSPTAKATFDDNTWLYIGEVTRPVIAATNTVLEQQVILLTFDGGGVLRDISRRSEGDAVPVAVVSRATPAPGNEATIMQQLLGNVGKFSPSPTDSGRGKQGGATNPGNF
jgi:outer membrane protein assembly factor BamE (lipoprotein component of BamABCDE complex)